MSQVRAYLRKTVRIGILAVALGLALAGGIASPALAGTGNLSSPQSTNNAEANFGTDKSGCRDLSSSGDCEGGDDNSGCRDFSSSGDCEGGDDNSGCRDFSSSGDCEGGDDNSDCDSSRHYSSSDNCPPADDDPPPADDDPPPVVDDNDPPPVVDDNDPPPVVDDGPPADNDTPVLDDDPSLVDDNLPEDGAISNDQGQVLGTVLERAPAAAQSTNPLPTAAAAGEADTSGQLVAGGFTAFAGFLMLTAGFLRRRRPCEA